MFYEKDWFMRQIQLMIRGIARMFFGKDTVAYEVIDPQELSESDLLHRQLLVLLQEKRINDAEDLLFACLHTDQRGHLQVALDFYDRLSRWDEVELAACGFSQEEVKQGLLEVARLFGVALEPQA